MLREARRHSERRLILAIGFVELCCEFVSFDDHLQPDVKVEGGTLKVNERSLGLCFFFCLLFSFLTRCVLLCGGYACKQVLAHVSFPFLNPYCPSAIYPITFYFDFSAIIV